MPWSDLYRVPQPGEKVRLVVVTGDSGTTVGRYRGVLNRLPGEVEGPDPREIRRDDYECREG